MRDPESRAYSAAYLAEAFERERGKAVRFRRPLSLVFLAIDGGGFPPETVRDHRAPETLACMVEELRKTFRGSDFIARFAHDRFCVVLPETDRFGSVLAIRRLRKTVREMEIFRFPGRKLDLDPVFAPATWPLEGESFADLYRSAENKLLRRRESPLHRLRLEGKTFWEACRLLASGADVSPAQGRSGRFSLHRRAYLRLVEAIAQDVCAIGDSRAIVIAAGPRPEIFKQICLSFNPGGPERCAIRIVGRSCETPPDDGNMTHFYIDDEALEENEFLLYRRENGAYGIFAAVQGEEVRGFHSADEWLVDAMTEKLQETYPSLGTH
ncbi:MAG: diguanylate cyclase [Deltaproteobacteria bacterium]|nr:diguanylate cyclase [Deltaproteobacteria bacterium]